MDPENSLYLATWSTEFSKKRRWLWGILVSRIFVLKNVEQTIHLCQEICNLLCCLLKITLKSLRLVCRKNCGYQVLERNKVTLKTLKWSQHQHFLPESLKWINTFKVPLIFQVYQHFQTLSLIFLDIDLAVLDLQQG
jgi:hypothetical protein